MPSYRLLHGAASVLVSILVSLVAGTPGQTAPQHQTVAAPATYRVLVYTRATGFKHTSTPAGVAAIQALGAAHGFAVDTTADPTVFNDAALSQYSTVVFLSTSGNPVPTDGERAAFQRYIEAGGGFVGVHAASDGGWKWPWYGHLVGTYFRDHPKIQMAFMQVEDHTNPATTGLTDRFRVDEWYDFTTDPRPHVRVLATVDDDSYTGSKMGSDHPVTWCQNFDGGRSFYTGLGHSVSDFSDPFVLHQLLGGIQITAGVRTADCSPS